jgi:hypothetical protein
MSSLFYPSSTLRSTPSIPSSSHSQSLPPPAPAPSRRRLVIDEWDDSEQPRQDDDDVDDDDFLLGFSLASQDSEEDLELATPASSPPDVSQIRGDRFEDTFLSGIHPIPPSSLAPILDTAGVDEDDDAAFFEFLMKRRETRRDVELIPAHPAPAPHEPAPPDKPASNDPLDLYFKVGDDESSIVWEEQWML